MPKDEIKNMVDSSKDEVRREFENLAASLQSEIDAMKKSALAKI